MKNSMFRLLMVLSCILEACAMASPRSTPMQDIVAAGGLDLSPTAFFTKSSDVKLADDVGASRLKEAERAINSGADVNALGERAMTPLLWALGRRNLEGFKFLLNHGADPNLVTCCDGTARGVVHSLSPMAIAAGIESSVYLHELLDHKGNPNLVINEIGETPIFRTLLRRRSDNAILLIEHGADLGHQTNITRKTPLAEAANQANYQMALILFRAGADPTIKNRWGYSVIDNIIKFGNRGVLYHSPDVNAYDDFIVELKKRGLLGTDPPQF